MCPGVVAGGAGKDNLFGPHGPRLLDVVLGQCRHAVTHPGDVERVATAPLVAAQRGELYVGPLHNLHERLGDAVDTGIKGTDTADKIKHLGLSAAGLDATRNRVEVLAPNLAGLVIVARDVVAGANCLSERLHPLGNVDVHPRGVLFESDHCIRDRDTARTAHLAGFAGGTEPKGAAGQDILFHPQAHHLPQLAGSIVHREGSGT